MTTTPYLQQDDAPSQTILVGIPTTLDAKLTGADGEPRAGLTATVTVTRANGAVLYTAAAATDNTDGSYSLALVGADVATLDFLTAVWTVGGNVRATTTHSIVGGFYFTQGDIATAEAGRASLAGSDFTTLRLEVEQECERICGVAFVPRYRQRTVDGTGTNTLWVPDTKLRRIRSVTFWAYTTSSWALSSQQLAQLSVNPAGVITSPLGGVVFSQGCRNVTVEYECGYDRPPDDLKRAAIRRFRTRSNKAKSGIPDLALSYTGQNGATYRLAVPDANSTGDPDIDAVYHGYRTRQVLIA